MPLNKPTPGQELRASDQRDLVLFVEASKPLPGYGITIRRTPAGSTISLSKVVLSAASTDDGTESTASGGIPDGTEIWGRVYYDTTNKKFVQYKDVWDAESGDWVESTTAIDIVTLESHSSQHA